MSKTMLVTGGAASGKTRWAVSYFAACIRLLNDKIPTLEELKMPPALSYALRSALREDPDVILVGEMRDFETISLAMTAAVKNLIRGNKISQIESTLQTSKGMCTLNDSLAKLYKKDLISYETALEYSTDRQELEKTLQSMAGF